MDHGGWAWGMAPDLRSGCLRASPTPPPLPGFRSPVYWPPHPAPDHEVQPRTWTHGHWGWGLEAVGPRDGWWFSEVSGSQGCRADPGGPRPDLNPLQTSVSSPLRPMRGGVDHSSKAWDEPGKPSFSLRDTCLWRRVAAQTWVCCQLPGLRRALSFFSFAFVLAVPQACRILVP